MIYLPLVLLGLITPLFPLLGIVFSRTQKMQTLLLSASLTGIFVFFTPLDGFDLLVHYENFDNYVNGQYVLFNRYIGIDALIYVLSHLELKENSLVLVTSFFLFYSTYKFTAQRAPENKLLVAFILVVASYPLVLLISGVRYSIALSFFLLSDIQYIKRRYFSYIFFAILSIVFHYAASVLVVIYILSRMIKLNKLRTGVLLCMCVGALTISIYQSLLIELISFIMRLVGFEKYVGLDLSRYVTGEWGALRAASFNMNGIIGYYLPKLALCIMGFSYFFYVKNKDSFLIFLFLIYLLLFNFGDIGDRYAICLLPYLVTSFFITIKNISLNKFPVPVVIILAYLSLNMFKEFLLYGEVYSGLIQQTLFFDSPALKLFGG